MIYALAGIAFTHCLVAFIWFKLGKRSSDAFATGRAEGYRDGFRRRHELGKLFLVPRRPYYLPSAKTQPPQIHLTRADRQRF